LLVVNKKLYQYCEHYALNTSTSLCSASLPLILCYISLLLLISLYLSFCTTIIIVLYVGNYFVDVTLSLVCFYFDLPGLNDLAQVSRDVCLMSLPIQIDVTIHP